MNKKHFFSGLFLLISALVFLGFYPQENNKDDFSERVKIILRQVANQLLLSNEDSTSLVLPVKKIEVNKYQISFEKELKFEPSILVEILKRNFKKSAISSNYRVEVTQCLDNEVAYSYEINIDKEKTIIPCAGRFLPEKCYTIQVHFLEEETSKSNLLFYLLSILIIIIIFSKILKTKKEKAFTTSSEKQSVLGSFTFYPEQNKLVKKAKEIALSNKECELLAIFIANANQVVKREELTKRVWEDNGVIVGRSLDTYISKLRKKLQEDDAIKLTNIHGVGYKLEVK